MERWLLTEKDSSGAQELYRSDGAYFGIVSHPDREALVRDANRGALAHEEDAAIDSAVDAAIETTRHRTPAQSADGFLRDALVMLADGRYYTNTFCGTAVRAIGKALEAVSKVIAAESWRVGSEKKQAAEGGDATAAIDLQT